LTSRPDKGLMAGDCLQLRTATSISQHRWWFLLDKSGLDSR
jgi:hypothetical protein